MPMLLGVGVVAWLLATQRHRVWAAVDHASPGWVLASVLAMAVGMLVLASGWADVLALLVPARPSRRRVIAAYFAGELGKYLPGGVFAIVGRGEAAVRRGIARPAAYASVVLSLTIAYSAAALTAGILAIAGSASSATPLLLSPLALGVPAVLLLLRPRALVWVMDRARRLTGRPLEMQIPPWRASVLVMVRYIPAWLFVAAATWSAARALVPDPSPWRIGVAAIASWCAGFIAGPAPAGAGVREATFIAVAGLPPAEAAAVALLARGVSLVVDAVGGLTSLAFAS